MDPQLPLLQRGNVGTGDGCELQPSRGFHLSA